MYVTIPIGNISQLFSVHAPQANMDGIHSHNILPIYWV